jgi:hypothetical protein
MYSYMNLCIYIYIFMCLFLYHIHQNIVLYYLYWYNTVYETIQNSSGARTPPERTRMIDFDRAERFQEPPGTLPFYFPENR